MMKQRLTSNDTSSGHEGFMMIDPSTIILPEELPISQREDEIVAAIRKHQVVILRGETGSGKTTQIPKLCLKAGLGKRYKIGCTQPRRVAAFAVANRIAEELGEQGKSIVGTKIRFTDQTNKRTRIKIMTDGILLNEMQHDPFLRQYDCIVVDEAHERSLNIDFILGHLMQIRKKRKDLKIIVTSATIDTKQFSDAFGGAPVVEVTGRMYPVEVRYHPVDTPDKPNDYTYIDGCFEAVEEIVATTKNGDLLVFLPAEKDIRELCDMIMDMYRSRFEVVPLFGRLSQADQQRIFSRSQKRKIVVATNIAETSITVPGIRYVVDSGLARISRYSAHTRTQRLPIEEISQSSANQRKGRCGRVEEGICIRLYSEENFEGRAEFTPPEIFRSNLASVILRLKAFKFGDIETFPFLDRPEERALKGGMILLRELCAIDQDGILTDIGHKLARLPIDPTIGRMLLESQKFNVQRSVMIIASALAVQDPRERPLEKEAKADAEHRKFIKKDSDYLSLLQIWLDFDEKYEKWSQGKMRKFCREHFISYQRLREWREIHEQIKRVLEDIGSYKKGRGEEEPDLIHRSILSGLIGNIAFREEGNWYQATRGRKVMAFPASVMFQKNQSNQSNRKGKSETKNQNESRKKEWVMAAEFVETSRLFARTIAKIDLQWIRQAGEHLLNFSYQEPHWSNKSQRVLCWKKEFLYGLLIHKSKVGFGSIEPAKAKEVFIQSGIIGREIRDEFPFLKHNWKSEDDIIEMQTRFRRSLVYDLEYRLYQFYDEQLPELSSVAELHKWWRSLGSEQREKMYLDVESLLKTHVSEEEKKAFPEYVDLDGDRADIKYRFQPGEQNDGAVLSLPLGHFAGIQEGSLDWIIPGFLEEKVEQLLRALPKDYRRFLTPVKDKTKEVLDVIEPSPASLVVELTRVIKELYEISIPKKAWNLDVIPNHLKLKIQLCDEEDPKKVLVTSDSWEHLKQKADSLMAQKGRTGAYQSKVKLWAQACQKWERRDIKNWSFGDLPIVLDLGKMHGVPFQAYPGLVKNTSDEVSVRLFKSRADALKFTTAGYRKLGELSLGREIGWFIRDSKKLKSSCVAFTDIYVWDEFSADVQSMYLNSLWGDIDWPLEQSVFEQKVTRARQRLRGAEFELRDLLDGIGEARLEFLNGELASHPFTKQVVARLFPKRFLRIYNFEVLSQFPRYLQAHKIRMKRLIHQPQKDRDKQARLQPMLAEYKRLCSTPNNGNIAIITKLRELFFALEEYRVSIFAQELGTKGKISEKVVFNLIENIDKDIQEI